MNLLVETVGVEREHVRINGTSYPYQLVKAKMLKLDYTHICYVLDCMQKSTTKIANIRAYLLTALYNASNTIESYYQAKVNHDASRKASASNGDNQGETGEYASLKDKIIDMYG